MSERTLTGSCQCGAVAFEAEASLDGPVACNCSRCRRLGAVLVFTPRDKFRLLRGEDDLAEYLFNRHAISHRFCRTCGIQCFAYGQMPDGTAIAAINLNSVDGVDTRALAPKTYDGAAV